VDSPSRRLGTSDVAARIRVSEVKREADSWAETEEEQAVRTAWVSSKKPLKVWQGGLNVSYDVHLKGCGRFVFKPKRGEQSLRNSIKVGTQYRREAAAFRIDRALAFNLVPLTVVRDIEKEVGSAQSWVEAEGWVYDYLKADQARLAVLDYILGNTDRHVFNWRTQADGRPSAIDNGLCLPVDASEPLRSRWIHILRDKDLPDPVLKEVAFLTANRVSAILNELGIEDAAIDGARRRLDEVQKNGKITLAAWKGGLRPS